MYMEDVTVREKFSNSYCKMDPGLLYIQVEPQAHFSNSSLFFLFLLSNEVAFTIEIHLTVTRVSEDCF